MADRLSVSGAASGSTGFTQKEIMEFLLQSGKIDLNDLTKEMEMTQRQQLIDSHKKDHKVWQGTNGYYYTMIPDPTKPKGQRLIKKKTMKDLETVIVEYMKNLMTMKTVKETAKEYIDRRFELGAITKSTKSKYESDVDRFFADIADKDITKLTAMDVTEFVENTVSKLHLRPKAAANLRTLVNGTFNYARKKGYISFRVRDALDDVDIPKNAYNRVIKEDEEEVYTEEDLQKLMTYLIEHLDSKNLCLLLICLTGCRCGEMTTVKHSDFEGNSIRIRRTQTRWRDENGKYHYDVQDFPKTEAGIRSAVIPLQYHWLLEKVANNNPDSDYVFLDINGKPFSDNIMNNRLRRVCGKIGIEYRSVHKLRKTYASILLDNNINTSMVIKLMGHTDISTTQKYYQKNRKNLDEISTAVSGIEEFSRDLRKKAK